MIWLLALSLVGMVGCTDPVTARLQAAMFIDFIIIFDLAVL